jgi:hypothetical protein
MDKRIKNITATAERLKTPTHNYYTAPLELVNPEETYLYNMTNYQDYAEFSRMFRYMNEPQTPLNRRITTFTQNAGLYNYTG